MIYHIHHIHHIYHIYHIYHKSNRSPTYKPTQLAMGRHLIESKYPQEGNLSKR